MKKTWAELSIKKWKYNPRFLWEKLKLKVSEFFWKYIKYLRVDIEYYKTVFETQTDPYIIKSEFLDLIEDTKHFQKTVSVLVVLLITALIITLELKWILSFF